MIKGPSIPPALATLMAQSTPPLSQATKLLVPNTTTITTATSNKTPTSLLAHSAATYTTTTAGTTTTINAQLQLRMGLLGQQPQRIYQQQSGLLLQNAKLTQTSLAPLSLAVLQSSQPLLISMPTGQVTTQQPTLSALSSLSTTSVHRRIGASSGDDEGYMAVFVPSLLLTRFLSSDIGELAEILSTLAGQPDHKRSISELQGVKKPVRKRRTTAPNERALLTKIFEVLLWH
jgi:hypothetical protein